VPKNALFWFFWFSVFPIIFLMLMLRGRRLPIRSLWRRGCWGYGGRCKHEAAPRRSAAAVIYHHPSKCGRNGTRMILLCKAPGRRPGIDQGPRRPKARQGGGGGWKEISPRLNVEWRAAAGRARSSLAEAAEGGRSLRAAGPQVCRRRRRRRWCVAGRRPARS